MTELTKNEIHTVAVEGYSSAGEGVARVGGRAVFIKGALRDEVCEIKILKADKTAVFARAEQILTPSPHRTAPACPHYGKCGGCDFLHTDYAEELFYKRQRVSDALRRIGGLDAAVDEIVPAPELAGYRNKVIFEVARADGKTVTGFYRPRSHDIIPVESCMIQAEVSARAAAAVRGWMDVCGVTAYSGKSRTGLVRHVFCRAASGTGQVQAALVTAERRVPAREKLVAALRERCPEITSIARIVNKTHGNTALTGEISALWGDDSVTDELCGLKFKLSPRSFEQVNRAQAVALYGRVAEFAALTKADTALDLYCGVGTITLALAQAAGRVIGAELVPDAVADAKSNAEINGVTNAEFMLADALDAAKTLEQSGVKPAAVIVDPPRKGLTPEVIDAVSAMSPERVVYVSCDPATLARDLKLFSARGYVTSRVTPFDMFPRCAHVECAALLTRA
ncbi:MAG: 23S rRNA (uracil(1939)-C(5))-methyltransferase RlmD [Oscillospiraceae bacterium]|jgi:23S rRNA (uracil1939-C5)-methyltransferase|nr:23S rRNA (uracil(1939)-C(5))-methyltransferase RlmD [Oscillospiraceae bacterium]